MSFSVCATWKEKEKKKKKKKKPFFSAVNVKQTVSWCNHWVTADWSRDWAAQGWKAHPLLILWAAALHSSSVLLWFSQCFLFFFLGCLLIISLFSLNINIYKSTKETTLTCFSFWFWFPLQRQSGSPGCCRSTRLQIWTTPGNNNPGVFIFIVFQSLD